MLPRLKYLWPARRRREERDMREELESLSAIAGPGELGSLALALEDARALWGWMWLESIAADLRYGLRTLRRQPGFAATAVLSLALAIGANSAVFSFADAVLLRPLPVPNPSAVLDICNATPDAPLEGMSFPDYRDLRRQSHLFSGMAAYRLVTVAAADRASAPARVRTAVLASDNYFDVLQVSPVAGRAFLPEEAKPPGRPVAVVSYDFARQYGGVSPVGSTLRINGIVFTIIGVAPESFTGLDRFASPTLYLPLAMSQRLAAAPADPLVFAAMIALLMAVALLAGQVPARRASRIDPIVVLRGL